MTEVERLGAAAKKASYVLATARAGVKNQALLAVAKMLDAERGAILEANARDVERAREKGVSKAMLDRLTLTDARIGGIIEGVLQVAALDDPVGTVVKMTTRPNGLIIGKRRVPLGVIGIIYEARPNVTVDAAALCLKAGNTVLLRGGSDAADSNAALAGCMRRAIEAAGLPADCICSVSDTDRKSSVEMMGLTQYLDVLIPRGGAGLIRTVAENSHVPVIRTGEGNCHVYVDGEADLQMGAEIIYNAKCSRPSVCNAAENLLVSRAVARDFLPMAKALLDKDKVEIRGCAITREILGDCVVPATREDYYTEFLDYILAVKVVNDVDEAIAFINQHSSGHSEAIVTNNYFTAQRFLDEVDSAAVYVNASTRYTDGFEFGLGAEIGISTQKLHARGPMGLEELTSTKFVVYGEGQVR